MFVLLDTAQFSDGPDAYQNFQLTPDGRKLTVPVKHPRFGKLIKDVEIDWGHYRPKTHIKALGFRKLSRNHVEPYVNALQFMSGGGGPSQIWVRLVDWNRALITHLDAFHFKSPCRWEKASEIEAKWDPQDKFFAEIMLSLDMVNHKPPLIADTYLLLLLKCAHADTYLAGPSWRSYAPNLDKLLEEHGIKLEEVQK